MLRSALLRVLGPLFRRLQGSVLGRWLWALPGSHRLFTGLMRRIRPETVRVRGHELELDAADSLLLSVNGEYEDWELDVFSACICEGDTVIDVGAHIGLYTLEAARAVGPAGRVLAFEPAVTNFEILGRNVARNGYANVSLTPAAVSSRTGSGVLVCSTTNSGDHRFLDRPGDGSEVTVETVTLDSELSASSAHSLPPVSVIKMDIQGAEPAAWDGAQRLVGAATDLVLFTEVSPSHLEGRGGATAYLEKLVSQGFALFEVDEHTRRLSPISPATLVGCAPADGRERHTDLVCAKGPGAHTRLSGFLGG